MADFAYCASRIASAARALFGSRCSPCGIRGISFHRCPVFIHASSGEENGPVGGRISRATRGYQMITKESGALTGEMAVTVWKPNRAGKSVTLTTAN